MRPRDLIVVGAVVLVAGFAAADALRSGAQENDSNPPTEPAATTPSRGPGPQPQPDAPEDWPVGDLEGSLVFTDAEDCRIRIVGLAGGRERPLARFAGTCDLWVPPVGPRLAYGLGPSSLDGFVPFKLADLAQPLHDLGGYRALFGVVLWSQDGQRVAWCGRRRVGFDLEVGSAARRLPSCPAAYTPDGRMAYAIGNELRVEDEVVHRADGGITYVNYGTDGSLALMIDGERLERWEDGTLTGSLAIPGSLQGATPVLRFDNCAAVFREDRPPVGGIRLLDLGCFPGDSRQFFQGTAATWSPDGRRLAVAEPDAVVFHDVLGDDQALQWPAQAVALAWRQR